MFTWGIIQSPYYLLQLRLVGLGAAVFALYVVYHLISLLVGS
jgi:hypothetical protein